MNGQPRHRARKRFGQNFLHDRSVVDRILAAMAPRSDDPVVEVGPGQGALTVPLVDRLQRLEAIEMDRDLAAWLRAEVEHDGRLVLHEADALRFDFTRCHPDRSDLRVVGNLPYNISTPLLFHLLGHAHRIRDLHLMLQREVVERMAAPPGSRTYGRLSVMVQYHCRVERLFVVRAGAFRPAPQVESAVVRLTPWRPPEPSATDPELLATIVGRAFGQRRKTLRNALAPLADDAALRAAGIDPGARPENVDVATFVGLANRLAVGAS